MVANFELYSMTGEGNWQTRIPAPRSIVNARGGAADIAAMLHGTVEPHLCTAPVPCTTSESNGATPCQAQKSTIVEQLLLLLPRGQATCDMSTMGSFQGPPSYTLPLQRGPSERSCHASTMDHVARCHTCRTCTLAAQDHCDVMNDLVSHGLVELPL